MKTDIFMLFAASALVLFSCAKEKSPAPEQTGQMRFAVTVEGDTKASMTSADLKQFYLKVTGPDNAFSYFDSIVKEGEVWKASSRRMLWKDEASSITYAAASYGALGPDYFNVSVTDAAFASGSRMSLLADQGTQEKINAADLLTMSATDLAFADTEDGVVPVVLSHGLAKANFKLTLAPEYFDNGVGLEASPITGLVLSGVHTSFFFRPLTGEVTIPSGAPKGVVIPFPSSYEPGTDAAKSAVALAEAILVPETFDAGALTLYFTVAGKDFTWTNSTPLTFEQGGEYTIPVSIDYNTVPSGPVTPDPAPTARTLAEATAEDIGKVVCAAGHLHDAKTAVPVSCTAVGILGKVTTTGHGLILALKDATSQTWNTINGWISVTTYAGTTLKVLPDDAARGTDLTSYTALGTTAVSNWAVAQKSDYEAIFINLGSTTSDEDGTTYDGKVNAYITTGVGGTAIIGQYRSATEAPEDYAWNFDSSFWIGMSKSNSESVRPVLGF